MSRPTPTNAEAWARAEAEKIVAAVPGYRGSYVGIGGYDWEKAIEGLTDAIASALLAARQVPEGMVRVGTTDYPMAPGLYGMPTRLDITWDGFVVGLNARLWRFNKASEEMELFEAGWRDQRTGRVFAPEVCYTTREAAERASKEQPHA